MQKVSHLIFAACTWSLASGPLGANSADNRQIAADALEQCFALSERLARLECYDVLLGRPQLLDDRKAEEEPVQIERVAELPRAISYANDLLNGTDLIGGEIHMTLRRSDGGENQEFIAFEGEGLEDFLNEQRTEEEAKKLRVENDLFLAIESDTSIGEPATLILSCENNISRLKVVFNQPFGGRFVGARFFGSEKLSEESALSRKLWVRSDGYLLENARGLDSIQLIARIVSGALSQVSVGEGEAIRSAFFKTDALKQALPYLARHCSWSPSVTK